MMARRMPTLRSAPARALSVLTLSALAAAACSGPEDTPLAPASERWPAGTVIAVGDQPLGLEELQVIARGVAALFPGEVPRAHLRRALKTTVLPRLAVAAVHSPARAKALTAAEQRLAELRAEPARSAELALEFGNWKSLDLELWAAAQDSLRAAGLDDFAEPENVPPAGALPAAWFGPVEVLGEFVVARVEGTRPGRTPADLQLELRLQRFGFLRDDFDIHDLRGAYAQSDLEIVDEEIGDLISGFYLQQLGH